MANLCFQFGNGPWRLIRAKCYLSDPKSQICWLGPGAPLVANYGIFTHKHHLVVTLRKGTWSLITATWHGSTPLVANYGNLAKEQPLVVILNMAPWWLISATLHRSIPWWPILVCLHRSVRPLTLQLCTIFGEIPLVLKSLNWLGLGVPPDGRIWQLSKGLPTGGHFGHHIWEEHPASWFQQLGMGSMLAVWPKIVPWWPIWVTFLGALWWKYFRSTWWPNWATYLWSAHGGWF